MDAHKNRISPLCYMGHHSFRIRCPASHQPTITINMNIDVFLYIGLNIQQTFLQLLGKTLTEILISFFYSIPILFVKNAEQFCGQRIKNQSVRSFACKHTLFLYTIFACDTFSCCFGINQFNQTEIELADDRVFLVKYNLKMKS